MEELLKGSATEMARAVRSREVSPVELVEAHIRRAEERDGDINAMVLPRYDEAMAEARAAEDALDRGDLGPLHGVPYTAKECIEVAGMVCTDGSKLFEGNVSTEDATVIVNLREAGAILLGKTNIPEFALHYDSNNLVYGATGNPHDTSRSRGRLVRRRGSGARHRHERLWRRLRLRRIDPHPRRFCGVVGIRPGRWIVPYKGHSPAAHDDERPAVLRDRADGALRRGPRAAAADLRAARPGRRSGRLRRRLRAGIGRRPARGGVRGGRDHAGRRRSAGRRSRAAGRALADAGHEVVEERPPIQAEVRECSSTSHCRRSAR